MDPLIGAALIGGGAGGVGQLASFGLSQMAASKSWDRQKNLMTRGPMYNMIGLEQAGLNPILAVKNVGNTSGNVHMARAPDIGGAMAAGASSAVSAGKAPAEVALKKQEKERAKATTDMTKGLAQKAGWDTRNAMDTNSLIAAQTAREWEAARGAAYEADVKAAAAISAEVDRRIDESPAEYYRRMIDRYIGTASDGVRLITQPVRDIFDMRPDHRTESETIDRRRDPDTGSTSSHRVKTSTNKKAPRNKRGKR